jgi:integrase/recombinase XerD
MNDIINEYLNFIKQKKLSDNTVEAYTRDIMKFHSFLKEKKVAIHSVENLTMMTYVQELKRVGKSEASIARNIICIRNFYKYLAMKGMINKISLIEYEIPKFNRNLPSILTIDEVDKLLSAPDINTNKGKRDKAMLELMYGTGIKVTELLELSMKDVNLKLNYIKCSGTKNRERVIPMGSYAVAFINEYLSVRDNFISSTNNEELIFLNSYGNRMSRQGFWKIIKAYGKSSGINKYITLNTLRHSFAVHLIENGADIKSVQEFLGYKDISGAQIYLDIAQRNKLGEVYKKTHPRA